MHLRAMTGSLNNATPHPIMQIVPPPKALEHGCASVATRLGLYFGPSFFNHVAAAANFLQICNARHKGSDELKVIAFALAQLQYHDVAVFEHYQCTSASWASTAILPCLSDHIHI